MKKSLLTAIFFSILLNILVLLFVINLKTNPDKFFASIVAETPSSKNIVSSPIESYYAQKSSTPKIYSAVGRGDSRAVIVDNFLARHNSPMSGLGTTFVSTADKYGLDYRLMPAIAFQESTLGKNIPKGSHNAWGWAIYTGADSGARFHDWQFAIETVAKGLKYDYIDRGLTTPEAIMTRYADSEGAWAFGVEFAMSEMAAR
ncbi:MAG TPA: hypothetical protein VLE47_04755 [Candidatus Saccharimonadales bacterium]|nr:hypothetical protein [Candidatus Saccharimonadales bacterium]